MRRINEWELPYYNPLYQMNHSYDYSVLLTLSHNPHLLKSYVGFSQYDQQVNVESFREIIKLMDESNNIFFGAFSYPVHFCFDILSDTVYNDFIIGKLNQIYSETCTIKDITHVYLTNAYILPKTIFLEMMDFMEKHVLSKLMMYLRWDVRHFAGTLERCIGIYLGYRILKGHFDKVVEYKADHYNDRRVYDPYRNYGNLHV